MHVELSSNGLGESRLKQAKLVHEGLQVGGIFVSLSVRFLGKRKATYCWMEEILHQLI